MASANLARYFAGIAAKRLSAVEIDPRRSNQHEFDGVKPLRGILGDEKLQLPARFMYLPDDESQTRIEDEQMTWYDARERHATRTEYRLYRSTNIISEVGHPGDLLIVALRHDRSLLVICTPKDSTAERQLTWLFGLGELSPSFFVKTFAPDSSDLSFVSELILEELGIQADIDPSAEGELERMLRLFDGVFPSTLEFSLFARGSAPGVSAVDDPDAAVMTWLKREEHLFRVFERHMVAKRLSSGFGKDGEDVESFIEFSLSVQNRRKSRAGYAAENHLEEIFRLNRLRFARNAKTERKSKPDFLFPGLREYRSGAYPATKLSMLGVKTTCKDRWRQVLTEADRISLKHLFTLQPAISSEQTSEMIEQHVQLVVPTEVLPTFSANQRAHILSLRNFIEHVKTSQ